MSKTVRTTIITLALAVTLGLSVASAKADPPGDSPSWWHYFITIERTDRDAWCDFAGQYKGKGKPEKKAAAAADYADLMLAELRSRDF